jgi:hypothetical protein
MGGERGSTSRMRMAGKICCFCHSILAPPYPGEERACSRCEDLKTARPLYMRFERCLGWRVTFRDLGDPSREFRQITFADSDKIEALIARTPTQMILEVRQALEHGIRAGVGGGESGRHARSIPQVASNKSSVIPTTTGVSGHVRPLKLMVFSQSKRIAGKLAGTFQWFC